MLSTMTLFNAGFAISQGYRVNALSGQASSTETNTIERPQLVKDMRSRECSVAIATISALITGAVAAHFFSRSKTNPPKYLLRSVQEVS